MRSDWRVSSLASRTSRALGLLLGALALTAGCAATKPAEDATAAASSFWHYVAEKDIAGFCTSLTDDSLLSIYDEPSASQALKKCLRHSEVLDAKLAAVGALAVNDAPKSTNVVGIHATVRYGGGRELRLTFSEDRGWLVELQAPGALD